MDSLLNNEAYENVWPILRYMKEHGKKLEQESIILYNEEESTASIYTHDPKLKRKLKRHAEKYPDKVYPDRTVHAGAVSYAVPKSCVSVREPFSDERRRAASERAKNAGFTPPARSIYSENE